MSAFENKQGINTIEMSQNIQAYCPLGKEYYTNKVSIVMDDMKVIPDYCDVDKFLRSLSGKEMIIEDIVNTIFEYFEKECNPEHLAVSSDVDDAVHLPVRVTKVK